MESCVYNSNAVEMTKQLCKLILAAVVRLGVYGAYSVEPDGVRDGMYLSFDVRDHGGHLLGRWLQDDDGGEYHRWAL